MPALFTSAEECCTIMVPWIAKHVCVGESTPPYEAKGTGKWFVSYQNQKCVQDCPVGSSPLCGGVITENSIALFNDARACCSERLWWVDLESCASN